MPFSLLISERSRLAPDLAPFNGRALVVWGVSALEIGPVAWAAVSCAEDSCGPARAHTPPLLPSLAAGTLSPPHSRAWAGCRGDAWHHSDAWHRTVLSSLKLIR